MPLLHRPERWRAAVLAAALLAAPAVFAQPEAPPVVAPAAASAPSRAQVDEAARSLRDIPTLTGQQKARRLHFKSGEPKERERGDTPAWLRWIADFMQWFNEAGRWLVWLLLALAIGALLLWLRRWFGASRGTASEAALSLPTQVRGLDIHPDSLPDDVGAAAWALWQRGEPRACLSLLYRGALSQLVHGHAVPIRASSTEGDCLRLAEPRLPAPAAAYLRGLVAVWAQAVYGARAPAAEQVRPLCEGFAVLRPAVVAA
jgi:hypothetical protein